MIVNTGSGNIRARCNVDSKRSETCYIIYINVETLNSNCMYLLGINTEERRWSKRF